MEKIINPEDRGIKYDLFYGKLDEISFDHKVVINTINQYSYCVARHDPEFQKALKASDILLPDGEGIVLAERLLTGKKIQKISGTDLHLHLLSILNHQSGKCFYLGSSEETLDKIKLKLSKEYPNLKVATYAPPFSPSFSDRDNAEMIKAVNTFKPDALFIGLTAPKQEKWSGQFRDQINAKVICSIGAVFDFYAETVKRPCPLLIRYKLEWLGRLISNPVKMWRRYLFYGPIYIFYILRLRLSTTSKNTA